MAEKEHVSGWQSVYDNIFILLILGVVVPTVVYTVWGLVEIMQVPQLPVVNP